MDKKGEINWTLIFSLVVVIVTLVILLYFYYSLNFTSISTKEACHASVIFRATSPAAVQDYVPLKCQTDKICITSTSGGNCKKDFGESAQVRTIQVSKPEQVEKIVASNLIDCWNMMGEGKLSLFSNSVSKSLGLTGDVYPGCVVCTRIAFDQDSLKGKVDLTQVNPSNYMNTHLMPGKDITYTDYFFKEGEAKLAFNQGLFDQLNEQYPNLPENQQATSTENTNQIAIMFMQISVPSVSQAYKNLFLTLAGAGLSSSYVVGGKTTFRAASYVCRIPGVNALCAIFAAAPAINTAENQLTAAGKCGDVDSSDGARLGCSVVRTVKYSPEDIKPYCGEIVGLN